MNFNKIIYNCTRLKVFVLALLIFSFNIQAQTKQISDEPFDSPRNPPRCEEWILYVSDALRRWNVNKKGSFIIIIKPGAGESRRLVSKRVKTIKEFITSLKFTDKLVFAESEKTNDYALVEIYVEGSLLYKLPIEKNGNAEFRACQSA